MSRWLTWRRLIAYGAYFTAAFSILIAVFISKQAWDLHKTVRLIEKSWDLRGTNYTNATWIDKAGHALFAGHEDVSEYNDLFWAKYAELDGEDGKEGSFDRSNLTTCKPGYEPEWVAANAGYEKWGFVVYRTDYDEDDETFAATMRHLNHSIRTHLELDAIQDGEECDVDYVRDRAVLEIVEDAETLKDASYDTVRALWRERVDSGRVDNSTKMGGWQWGWFRLNLPSSPDDTTERPKANGLSLNLCLVYDWHVRTLMMAANGGLPATGPRDPWEPFLVAIDGMWDPEKYMYLTSWAHGYQGYYGVALSILFNNFHKDTFEREMERKSPRMWMGGPMPDMTAPWWNRIFQALLSTTPAVARPGRFPFHDRLQEMKWPFVREDSHWKPVGDEKQAPIDERAQAAATSEFGEAQLDL